MRAQDRDPARKSIDRKLQSLKDDTAFTRPAKGWVKVIRESLGMTTRQLATRIGVSQSRAVDIEKAEITGSITLNSLQRAARALNCRLVYTLVPDKPLDTMVEERALKLAKRRIQSAHHTMGLENQWVDQVDEQEQLRQLTKKLVEKSGSVLWED